MTVKEPGTGMNMTIRLNAEVQRRLRGESARNGLTVEVYIEQLERFTNPYDIHNV
jgi:hypothetical protein